MAYTDDSVRAKLSALNETQESIVTTAQWVMFHRRHADHTVQLWFQRLKDSGSNKRLNLIYLANDIVQQSRARRKEDFPTAFSPIIAEATAIAYKGANHEVQQKLRRVVEVWRQRSIFEAPIQTAVETRINDVDKSKGGGKLSSTGGSFLSASTGQTAPAEMQPLIGLQSSVTRKTSLLKGAIKAADIDYDTLTDPNAPETSAPRQSAQLGGLLKSLAQAELAVTESINARSLLIEGLEKILETNQKAIEEEKKQHDQLKERKAAIELKKQKIEDELLREMTGDGGKESGTTSGVDGAAESSLDTGASADPERPQVEPLSPEIEALTPTGSPLPEAASHVEEARLNTPQPEHADQSIASQPPLPIPGFDLLSSLSLPQVRPTSGSPVNGLNTKRRKLNQDEEFAGFAGGNAMEGLDDDVAELLRQESGGYE